MVMTKRIVAFLAIAFSLVVANPSRPALPAVQVTGPAMPAIQVARPVVPVVRATGPALPAVQTTGPVLPIPQMTGPMFRPHTYYISRRGNNLNPGTYALPLRTIQAGVNKAYAGDTVMVLAGTYKEQVTFPRGGTEGFPITVRGEVDGGGNPLAVIDNAASITATWIEAPEVGSGVYKTVLGYTATMILVDSERILQFGEALMAGDSSSIGIGEWPGTGLHMLAFSVDKKWSRPFGRVCAPVFWDGVGAAYGTIGDTTYIRFKDGDDPNTKNLRGVANYPFGIFIDKKDYIVLEHLRIQGSSYPVWMDSTNSCVIQDCVVRHGFQRIGLNYGNNNAVRDCDLSFGAYSSYFGEWGTASNDSLPDEAALCVMSYCFRKWMDGDIGGVQIIEEDGDEISGNTIHNSHVGIVLRPNATHTKIFDNTISQLSAAGIEQQHCTRPDSSLFHNNTMLHCDIAIRISAIGEWADTCRRAYIYNNRSWSSPNLGQTLVFHEVSEYDTMIFYGWSGSPKIYWYHNSFAGGDYWGNPATYACDSMVMVNNIMSSRYLLADLPAIDIQDSFLFKAFDYNFMGGGFRYYAPLTFAMTDGHNFWPADSTHGDTLHQVWPLGSEPDWTVPDTNTAYRSGLDLSDSFTIRGVTYGPLPGMTPGYFPGAKPNLGAVQNTGHVGMQQRDPGHGSVTQLPELAFAPNPATGRYVTARYDIAAGTLGKLTLRDVLGRTIGSFELDPSGRTRLDLRGFAPGMYFARLEADDRTIRRKLIITDR